MRVSVIIPTYNRAAFVAEAIQSVQAQTHPDIEIIVVDDASTDHTVEMVRRMMADDPRISLICQPENRRVNAARNAGLCQATGDYINFLDSDDLLAPDKLTRQLALFERIPDLDGVICQTLIFRGTPDQADRIWNRLDSTATDYREILTQLLSKDTDWAVMAPLWKRAFLDRLGPMPDTLYASDEREFHIRAVCHAPRLVLMDESLAYAREHDQPSGLTENIYPFKLRARLTARHYMWNAIRDAGLATFDNRKYLASDYLLHMRILARMHLRGLSLLAWAYAVWISPGLRAKLLLVGLVLPVLGFMQITGRGEGILKRLLRNFDLERPIERFRKLPVSAAEYEPQ